MKKKSTALLDEHLLSLTGMQAANTDDFFYTRLKARLQHRQSEGKRNWNLPLRPAWVLAGMALLLAVNILMLSQKFSATESPSVSDNTLQAFAASYDQTISSY